MSDDPPQHKEDHSKHLLLLGLGGALGSVILAPYILPLLGVSSTSATHRMMGFIGGEPAPGFYGTGIAGALQETFASLPLIGNALTSTTPVTVPILGSTIASGALTTLLASSIIGIGGTMLANWMEKRETANDKIHWSKIVRTVSLTTSILISLPSILTGISIGITFLANLMNASWGNQVAYAMAADYGLGAISSMTGNAAGSSASSGIMAILPHLLTCGPAMLPVMLAMFAGKKHPTQTHNLQLIHTNTSADHDSSITLTSATPTVAGKPCHITFRLTDKTSGKNVTPDDLSLKHTKKIHTMIVDQSLQDYHHIHPEYDPLTGLYTAQFIPNSYNSYQMWNDISRTENEEATILKAKLPRGESTQSAVREMKSKYTEKENIGTQIEVTPPLKVGHTSAITLRMTDRLGKALNNLEPIMGSYGHLVGFSYDGNAMIHCHPTSDATPQNGTLTFHITPEYSGVTRFFLQIQQNGQQHTLPFDIHINKTLEKPTSSFASRLHAENHTRTHGLPAVSLA